MLRIILYAILIWFLYNLIFGFIIPVFRTTKDMKKKFRQMHEQMEQQQRAQQGPTNPSQPTPKPETRSSKGDYIDFEEVK